MSLTTVLWLFVRGDTTRGMTLFLPVSPLSLLTTCERACPSSADLPGAGYSFPSSVALTDVRPDIVMWDSSKVHLVELTVPFETGLEDASQRKATKYADLVVSCRDNGYTTTLMTIQVGSRGYLHRPSLDNLYKLVKVPSPRVAANCESCHGILCHLVQPQPLFLKKLFQITIYYFA